MQPSKALPWLVALSMLAVLPVAPAWADDEDEEAAEADDGAGDAAVAEILGRAGVWTLDFRYQAPRNYERPPVELSSPEEEREWRTWAKSFYTGPRRITVKRDTGDDQAFWYLPYTITNKESEDHRFFLDVRGKSDKSFRYHDVPEPLVVEEVARQLKAFDGAALKTAVDVGTPESPDDLDESFPRKIAMPLIKAGETWYCVAIFHWWDAELDKLQITVDGLSNDQIITAPADHRREVTFKTLLIEYERPGDEFYTTLDAFTHLGDRWVTTTLKYRTDLKDKTPEGDEGKREED